MKKFWLGAVVLALAWGGFSPARAGETTIGGHFKFGLVDYVDGTHNDTAGSQYGGFLPMTMLVLYVSQEITDKLSIDLQPEFAAEAGATPKLGMDIGAQREPAVAAEFDGWVKAVVKVLLPYEIEVSAGIVKPRFTWDYGAEMFWQEEFNGSKFAANPYLGAMHDSGLEVYRTFEPLAGLSLPVYFYLLNGGSEFGDNNRHPAVMLRVEPETGPLRFAGSAEIGTWDPSDANDFTRFSAGAEYTYQDFSARGEVAGGKWANAIGGSADALAFGYYLKLFYRFAPWGRAMLHYNLADHNFSGFVGQDFPTDFTASAGEKYVTLTPGLQFFVTESSILIVQYDIADWRLKDDSDRLQFKRLTVGWRTTF